MKLTSGTLDLSVKPSNLKNRLYSLIPLLTSGGIITSLLCKAIPRMTFDRSTSMD